MALNNEDRGMLERTIDDALLMVPTMVRSFRAGQQRLHLREPNDAAFGCVWGYIMALFVSSMATRLFERGGLTVEMMSEATNIIFNRSDEIRNRIHEAG